MTFLSNYFTVDVISYSDYYPFGMLMPNRNGQDDDYRYGFNGMEKDDEVKGTKGASYDFGARMLDVRIGRWLSGDALQADYPSYSPYNYVLNNPLVLIDPDGNAVIWHADAKNVLGKSFRTKLENNSAFKQIFNRYIKNSDDHIFGLDLLSGGALGHGASAKVARQSNGYVTNIQSAYFVHGRIVPDETFLVLVILHEGIHQRKNLRRDKDGIQKYPGYDDHYNNGYFQNRHAPGDLHHNQMAEFNRGELITGMKEFDKASGTKHSEDWYTAMSWFGLDRTDSWKNFEKKNPTAAANYKKMITNEVNFMEYRKALFEYRNSMGTSTEQQMKTAMETAKSNVNWKLYRKTRKIPEKNDK